ncbi:MAG: 50S ribosomal protein L4 [bacterium]|jgi:large subunit ribosomal protein L4
MQKIIKVYKIDDNFNNQGSYELKVDFNREPIKELIHMHLVRQWANRRLGTVKTKRRGEVRGGGRKPWAQKHTGRARHGSIRSPIWRKGGVVFGPQPRDFSIKMNKKQRKLALYSLINIKLDDFIILETYPFKEIKTKNVENLAKSLNLDLNSKIVYLYAEKDDRTLNMIKSVRNHKTTRKILKADNLNVEDILSANKIILDKKAWDRLNELFIDYVNNNLIKEKVKN